MSSPKKESDAASDEPLPWLVSLQGNPGVTRVLLEVEKQKRGRWMELGTFAQAITSPTPPPVDEEKGIVIGAWNPQTHLYLLGRIRTLWPKARVTILWTSPIAQTEYSEVEMLFLKEVVELVRKGTINSIWFGDRGWMHLFRFYASAAAFYAPYPMKIRNQVKGKKLSKFDRATELQVGLLGPMHPRKNVMNQLAAIKVLFPNIQLHTNTFNQAYTQMADLFDIKHVAHGWLSEPEYTKLVASLNCGMQVSHSGVESRSFVFWDFLMQDVPCLSSIEDAPDQLRINPDDVHRMSMMLENVRAGRLEGHWRERAREFAERVNKQFNAKWSELRF